MEILFLGYVCLFHRIWLFLLTSVRHVFPDSVSNITSVSAASCPSFKIFCVGSSATSGLVVLCSPSKILLLDSSPTSVLAVSC